LIAASGSTPLHQRLERAYDEAVLVFSSGTTGLPKAVRHTHASIGHARSHWCRALGLGPHDRFRVSTPRLASGKVLRRVLRDEWAEEL
jgi:acyl-coenzyme A synthetase/AMP-(fatty) acid ligase